MKRSLLIGLILVMVLSLSLVAADVPPANKEKPSTEFFATESCTLKQGEEIDQDGWTYFRGQMWMCTLTSTDPLVTGSGKVELYGPWARHQGQQHTIWAHFHLDTATVNWVGWRWGTIDKDGNIKWINGYAYTPEAGWNYRHIMRLRYDGASVYGWYDTRGE